ncbi:hypothetical protein ACFVJK_41535 [Streptomyces sp. NPDC127172]|uniref:hypothetical protein n=1 Tax=Streptomyces sp. NPDC127172 TaxID=3345382 RepID=UPI003630C41C
MSALVIVDSYVSLCCSSHKQRSGHMMTCGRREVQSDARHTQGAASAGAGFGAAADIAAVVAFLASPDGGWVTAGVIDSGGGVHLGPMCWLG